MTANRRTYGHYSITMPQGSAANDERWNIEAFLIVCFVWHQIGK